MKGLPSYRPHRLMQVLPGHPLADVRWLSRGERETERGGWKPRRAKMFSGAEKSRMQIEIPSGGEGEREGETKVGLSLATPVQPHRAEAGAARPSPGSSQRAY